MPNTEKPTPIIEKKKSKIVEKPKKMHEKIKNIPLDSSKKTESKTQEKTSEQEEEKTKAIAKEKNKSKEIHDNEQKETQKQDNSNAGDKHRTGELKTQKAASESKEDKKSAEIKDKDKETLKKETKKEKPVIKKETAMVNGFSLPISTKHAVAICRFIKYKTIDRAIEDLEDVIKRKKHVPMKGEIPHRKGKGKIASGSGRYPKKASLYIIKLLKSLKSNAEQNNLDEPIISLAIANIASRPFGRFGRTKKKRTHIKIIATELKLLKKTRSKK